MYKYYMYVHICINRRKNKIPAAIASPTTTASTASATAAASPPGIRADLDTHLVVQALAAVEIPARIPLHVQRTRATVRHTHTHKSAKLLTTSTSSTTRGERQIPHSVTNPPTPSGWVQLPTLRRLRVLMSRVLFKISTLAADCCGGREGRLEVEEEA